MGMLKGLVSSMNIIFRKAQTSDDLVEIAELLYLTDQYIYPYWFNGLDNCKKELPKLLLEDGFFFNTNNLFVAIDSDNNKIVGVICAVDKSVDLNYDYTELKNYNERYKFTIENYIMGLIDEVQNADFAYISNVCVHPDYRGQHIGTKMLGYVIDYYKERYFNEVVLDVLADNSKAIKTYQNMGFSQFTDVFKGFNNPALERPNVFSMKAKLKDENDS